MALSRLCLVCLCATKLNFDIFYKLLRNIEKYKSNDIATRLEVEHPSC